MALAQGHAGASNNWWFGGSDCLYIGGNKVSGIGVNAHGGEVAFAFLRGGNSVSQVGISPVKLYETRNWMGQLRDDISLDQIMMPGSHDAGMSELSHCNPFVGSGPYTKTQSGSIGDQLDDGTRYFDIRVDYDHNELVTYHRTRQYGCNGQSLKAVLNECTTFLKTNPTETAILKFSHIRDYEHNPDATKKLIDELLNAYSEFICVNADSDVNLAKAALGDVRGKMILVFDYSEHIDSATGRFRYQDGSSVRVGANLTVYDVYSDTADYDAMKEDQLQKWSDYGGLGQDFLFLLSWTLTPKALPGIRRLAETANNNLPEVLYEQIVVNGSSKPNIVYIDFVNSETTQSIIQYNFT